MKIPKARKLPSGNWYLRLQMDGKILNITKPTKREAEQEAALIKGRASGIIETSLTEAIDDYITAREPTRSPATIRGYRTIQRNRFQGLMRKSISAITQMDCQTAVNEECLRCAPKTVENSWRFISSVLVSKGRPKIRVQLPQDIHEERPWLTPTQIPIFVEAVRGTKCEIPALMALSSLRRSEILAMRWCDIDLKKGVMLVRGAVVPDENNKLVYKSQTKNRSSRRTVPIIPPLMNALKEEPQDGEFVIKFCPFTIIQQIDAVCEKAGLPKVGFHGLRHSFASLAYHLKMPEKITMKIGGWADDGTMKKIYTHIADEDINQAADEITAYFSTD